MNVSKFFHNIYFAIIFFVLSLLLLLFSIFHYNLGAVSDDNEEKTVIIERGGLEKIANTLYKEGLIRDKFSFIVYVKISGNNNLKAATYSLAQDMGVRKIVELLADGKGENTDQKKITFKEGLNIRQIAKVIEENTNHSLDDVYNTLKDESFIKKMIDKYWFLSDDILNPDIYYSLEGYLYPDTYNFSSDDVEVTEIFDIMLAETEKKLEGMKSEFLDNDLSISDIFILASIVELEGNTLEDKEEIVGVFRNRLKSNMNLGSDVTTYYGLKINMGDRDLYSSEVNECNSYNTRCSSFKKLPVSPICNPSIESLEAVIKFKNNGYFYFVADKNKKIYFSKTLKEHEAIIRELKEKKLWLEY